MTSNEETSQTNYHQFPCCWAHKISLDWCFRLFKCLYRRTNITCLEDISETVEKSTKCNTAQLVARDGTILVPTYDWKKFFAPHFKAIPSIKGYHHFCFSSDKPGIVLPKKHADTEGKEMTFLKENCSGLECGPEVIPAKGLSPDRQWYLYDQIRQFCPESTKDLVCPLPSVPRN